jgi:hypothetical protein
MSERYGYGFGEDDLPASRRGPGVTGRRADEADEPEDGAEVREIDLAEDDPDDGQARDDADERVKRLREAVHDEDEDELDEARPPLELGARPGAVEEVDDQDGDEQDEEDRAADAPPAGAATVDISPPAGDGDQAAVLAADEAEAGADERVAAETGAAAGPGLTLAPTTPAPRPDAAGAEAAVATAGATPAPRSGALLAVDAEAIRRQFIDIQAGFVDEPRQAVEQAGELVEELHRKVMESLQAERGQLSGALDAGEPSTEDLRQALRAYRAYVDRLLGLSL